MKINISNLCMPRFWLPPKLLLIMRLIVVIMTTSLLQVSAGTFGQQVTLKQSNARLTAVLDEIRKQTGYDFFYSQAIMENAKPVTININQVNVEKALALCFKDQPLSYSIADKIVTVKEKVPSFLEGLAKRWAAIDVRGRVVDEKGDPLAGATVTVKATGKFVITNGKGEFYLQGVEEGLVLVVSYIGYTNREVPAKKDLGEIRLMMASADLNEVEINKGYYTTTRELNTGSVSKITAKEIEKQPINNPLQALQGRISGLNIIQQTGLPGGGFSIQLRGRNSIRGNGNDPYYIIDGVPYISDSFTSAGSSQPASGAAGATSPLNYISPSSIESIEVLKDADATAIYGSRGANGVILITTKKGKSEKTEIDFDFSHGFGKVPHKVDLLSTQEYTLMRNEAFKNDNEVPNNSNAYDLLEWGNNNNTDWQEKFIGNTARVSNLQFSISGGNKETQFVFGGTNYKESTVFPGDFSDRKISSNFKFDHISHDNRFNTTLSVIYVSDKNNLLKEDFTDEALALPPNTPSLLDNVTNDPLWPTGIYSNPYALMLQNANAVVDNLITNVVLSYKLLRQLKISSSLGYSKLTLKEMNKAPLKSFNPLLGNTNETIWSIFNIANNQGWIIEPQISWSTKLHNVNVNAFIGATFQNRTSSNLAVTGTGYSNESLMESISAASTKLISEGNSKYTYNSIYSRLSFDYKDRFVLNVTARKDGSSRFGPEKRIGEFGSIGAAWILSNESYIKDKIPLLSFAKIRSSYGITGNDQITDYQFYETWAPNTNSYGGSTGMSPVRIGNLDYSWETTRKFELSLELGLFNNRIMLNNSYYINRSSNQLVNYTLPSTSGFTTIQRNLDAIVQNTGYEVEITTLNINLKNFKWNSGLNFSFPKNKLIAFPNFKASAYASQFEIGKSFFIQKKFKSLSVNSQDGIYAFLDVDRDNKITTPNDLITNNFGQKFYGGLTNNFLFKNFELDFLFQFVKQVGFNPLSIGQNMPGTRFNQPKSVLNRWQEQGDVTNIEKYSQNYGSAAGAAYLQATEYGDNVLTDASFIRLKNLSISYRFSTSALKHIYVRNLKIYLNTQNLFTLTNYKGLDPENGLRNSISLPPLRNILFGIQFGI
jgi:TonB-linked SusC/RagA family outer membrane protein